MQPRVWPERGRTTGVTELLQGSALCSCGHAARYLMSSYTAAEKAAGHSAAGERGLGSDPPASELCELCRSSCWEDGGSLLCGHEAEQVRCTKSLSIALAGLPQGLERQTADQ